jgi:hypothetical protein
MKKVSAAAATCDGDFECNRDDSAQNPVTSAMGILQQLPNARVSCGLPSNACGDQTSTTYSSCQQTERALRPDHAHTPDRHTLTLDEPRGSLA